MSKGGQDQRGLGWAGGWEGMDGWTGYFEGPFFWS